MYRRSVNKIINRLDARLFGRIYNNNILYCIVFIAYSLYECCIIYYYMDDIWIRESWFRFLPAAVYGFRRFDDGDDDDASAKSK